MKADDGWCWGLQIVLSKSLKKTTQASVPGWNFHPSKMWWWSPIKQCSKPPLVDDYMGLYYIILTKSNQYMEDHRDLLGEPQARFQPEKKHCQRDQVASITIGKMRKCYEKKCGIIVKRGDTVLRMQPYATYKSKNYALINTLKSTCKNRESTFGFNFAYTRLFKPGNWNPPWIVDFTLKT